MLVKRSVLAIYVFAHHSNGWQHLTTQHVYQDRPVNSLSMRLIPSWCYRFSRFFLRFWLKLMQSSPGSVSLAYHSLMMYVLLSRSTCHDESGGDKANAWVCLIFIRLTCTKKTFMAFIYVCHMNSIMLTEET